MKNNFLKNNKKLSIFLLCLAVSTFLWVFMSFNRSYEKTINIPVTFKNIPVNKKIVNDSMFIKATFIASGWDLLSSRLKNTKIVIDLSEYAIEKTINFSNTKSLIVLQNNKILVKSTLPTFFTLKFEDLLSKTVPIKLNFQTKFSSNYFIKNYKITPDSIEISSDNKTLSTINFIETEQIIIKDEDYKKENISLKINQNINTNLKEIAAHFDIEEYAEKDFLLKVNLENPPKNKDIFYDPKEISLKCMVPFSEYDKISASDFYISADFNNIDVSKENTVQIKLKEQSKNVRNVLLSEDQIEFVIYSN